MSSTTTNLGLVKMASGETIGQWSDANNGSGANLDKIDTAIGNLNSQIGSIQYYYKNIGTSYSSYIERLEAAIAQSDFPTGKAVVGCILSGSYHFISGYLDSSKNGFMTFGNFAGGGNFRISAGTATAV